MKEPPDMQKLEEVMRSSRIVSGGLLGRDHRPVEEIIEDDVAALARLGVTPSELADRMEELTRLGTPGLGTSVSAGEELEIVVDESRGLIVCPWPHPGGCTKTVTTARRTDTGQTVRWSNLSIHMIREHGFFEGKGSAFRVEPEEVVETIFPAD